MKKVLPISIVIVLIVLGAGVYLKYAKTAKAPSITTAAAPTASPSVLTSISDAFTNKALSLQCNFTDDNGNQIAAYIKAGGVRTDIISKTPQNSGNMIFKDSKMYFWNSTTKQGFMSTLTDQQTKDMQNQIQSGTQPTGTPGQSALSSLQKFKDSCKPAVVDDSLFTPPTDIKFTDYSQLMNQMKAIPTGGQMSQQQIQQMMQQYQTTPGQ